MDENDTSWRYLRVTGFEVGKVYLGASATLLVLHALLEYEDPLGTYYTDSFCMRAKPGARSFQVDERDRDYNWRKSSYPKKQIGAESA